MYEYLNAVHCVRCAIRRKRLAKRLAVAALIPRKHTGLYIAAMKVYPGQIHCIIGISQVGTMKNFMFCCFIKKMYGRRARIKMEKIKEGVSNILTYPTTG